MKSCASQQIGSVQPRGTILAWSLWMRSCPSVACLVMVGLLSGCGGGAETPPATQPPAASGTPSSSSATPATGTAATPTTNAPSAAASEQTVDPERKETKWVGNIPYDVFFDQPLNIATDTTSLAATTPSTGIPAAATTAPASAMPAQASDAPQAPAASTSNAASAVNWGEVLPMPMLVDELKSLRTSLTGNLQTVATYNKSQNPIALDGAILAALAAVTGVHPGTVSWKPNAHFVRDLAFQINENSSGTGRGPYTKTKEPFDKILVILDGGNPPEMESVENAPFAEVVYVADMMKRIEQTFNNLKANINTEAKLKENAAAAEREVRILLTLATMMGDASYDNADQPAYQGFLKRFTDGARSGVQAIHTGNLDDFQAALNQIQTTCAECHQQYKGSESGF